MVDLATINSDFSFLKGVPGIYALVTLEQGCWRDSYVGKAIDLAARLTDHRRERGDSPAAHDAVAAGCTTVVILNAWPGLSPDLADEWLDQHERWWTWFAGYTETRTFNRMLGGRFCIVTDETKALIRAARLGTTFSVEARQKMSASQLARPEAERRACGRRGALSVPPQQRSENGRKGSIASNAVKDADGKSVNARKANAACNASLSPEQRRERSRKAGAATAALKDADGKSANARKAAAAAQASLTPAQKREYGRKGGRLGAATLNARLTREQKREYGRKAGHVRHHLNRNIVNPSCSLCAH